MNFRTGDDALSTVIKLVAIKPNFYVRRVILLSSDNMNKVINGNFDYGSAFWNYNPDEATVTSKNANNYFELLWGKTAKQDLTLKECTVYKLSFDQHFNEGASNENHRLITKITSGEKELLNVEPGIGYWQTAEFIFTTESDTAATLSFTAAGANHYFDNVTIEEVSPAGEYSIVNLGVNKSNGTLEGKKVTCSNAVIGLDRDSFNFNGTDYTVKSKGVLFAADNNIPDVLDKDAAGGFVMDVDIDDTCASVNGDIYTCTFSVDNIFEETYKVAARMYLDCTDADGKTVVFYGDTIIVE